MLAFNNSVTCPCEMLDLTISLGEGSNERMVNLFFLVIACRSTFSGILGISFLAKLDAMASSIHVKVVS